MSWELFIPPVLFILIGISNYVSAVRVRKWKKIVHASVRNPPSWVEDVTEEKAETFYKNNVKTSWIVILMGVFLFILFAFLSYLG